MKTTLVIILASALLSACASNQAVLTNASGQKYYCQTQGYGLISSAIANSRFEECVERARYNGYSTVEERKQ